MRYHSFYPFAGTQNSPYAMRQPFGGPQQQPPFSQPPRQPFQGSPRGNPFGQHMPGGPLQNTSKMEMYMQTANRFLNTAQQYAPLVQQIAPMFQNLPAMWRLYKGFQSLPTQGAAGGAAASGVQPTSTPSSQTGASNPRIFQPPKL
jgi:hypothetical protein